MGTIYDALAWSGSGATLSMFVVARAQEAPSLDLVSARSSPTRVRAYRLDDDAGILGGFAVFEYDAQFADVPEDLEAYLKSCLRDAIRHGAIVAWFAFEGSFDFECLLTPEIAAQVYAVADDDGVAIATDAQLESEGWRARVAEARQRVLWRCSTRC